MKKLKLKAVVINYPDLTIWRRNFAIVAVFIFCLNQLSGCGVIHQRIAADGAPRVDIDASKIRDAVPKVEPRHPYGTRNYVLGGRYYRVLKNPKGYVKVGYASWYGTGSHGKETATQERFNLYAMTAASPHLPLPSYVEVTNLRNGKKAIVRVNDRGPFYSNRIIDLSYAAAKKLDFVHQGVAKVRVVAIDPKTWHLKPQLASKANPSLTTAPAALTKPLSPEIFLQLGAFRQPENAKQALAQISQLIKQQPLSIEQKNNLYRVQIGPLSDNHSFQELKNLLAQHGFKSIRLIKEWL